MSMGQASRPATLENVLTQSANVLDQIDSLVRAAARIETMLTGRQLAMKERSDAPKPSGMVYGLNVNLLDALERVGELRAVLSNIEDDLVEPKVNSPAQALGPAAMAIAPLYGNKR